MYIDPGFGSMLIQALVASLAVGAAMLGIYKAKIKAFFNRKKNTSKENGDEKNERQTDCND